MAEPPAPVMTDDGQHHVLAIPTVKVNGQDYRGGYEHRLLVTLAADGRLSQAVLVRIDGTVGKAWSGTARSLHKPKVLEGCFITEAL